MSVTGPCGLRNECAWKPSLAGRMSPENSEGTAGSLCPPVGVAERGSAPFCPSCPGSWWARVALGSCSRLCSKGRADRSLLNSCLRYENLGDPTTRVMFSGMRILLFGERLYVWGLGWGLRTALSEPGVGVQDKAGIEEESRFPSTVPSGSTHTLVRECYLKVQQQCLSASFKEDVPGPGSV